MKYNDIDAYFVMASMGDDYAYRQIFIYFYNESQKVIKGVLNSSSCRNINSEEFSEYISILFLEAINDYDSDRAPFSLFAKYLVQLKLVRRVVQFVDTHNNRVVSLNENAEEDITYLDLIEDKTLSKEFKYSIASKDHKRTRRENLVNKVKVMLYAGYNQREICEQLKLSRSQVRQLIIECRNDPSIIDLKLELK